MVWFARAVLATAALASMVQAASDTCTQVKEATNIEMTKRLALAYTQEQGDYWSEACGDLHPSCILYPKSPNEVSAILKILTGNDENFAIKSGGHNPNLNFSSIKGGPLISTKKLNEITLDKSSGRVRIGPGNRWEDVMSKLDGSGWTVVGGRIGNVGVGGFMLGGGLSFLTQQYGWAVSSIIEMEVVLANGTIVTASGTQNEDLFKALKGGGNNFGLVTSYLVQGYKQEAEIYGGWVMFNQDEDTDARLLKALRDFTEYNTDDKAAIILTANKAVSSVIDIWTMFFFYDGPTPPEGIFSNFTDVDHTISTLKTRTYADLLTSNNVFVLEGSVYILGTETFPIPSAADSAEVMGKIHSDWREISSVTTQSLLDIGVTAIQSYQPFSKRMAKASRAKGDDLIDLDDDVDRIIVEVNYSYAGVDLKPEFDTLMEKTYQSIRTKVLAWQQSGKMNKDAYLPLFMNDASHNQDYFSRLRPENQQLAKSVADKYDPNGLFKTRTGGFKP